MILDKPEGGFIGTDHIGAKALPLTFFAGIILRQRISALAKGPHDQFPVLHFSKKIVVFAL